MFGLGFTKLGIPLLIFALGGIGGMFLQHKVFAPKIEIPACPDCSCPEPTVSVQPFDVEKIKGLREFNYSPQFTGSVSLNGVDSAAVKRFIDEAVMRAFDKHIKGIDKKKRR